MIQTISKFSLFTLFAGILSFSAYQGFTETQNGSGKTGHTGAPGEQTCTACHSPGTGGSGSLVISGDVQPNGYNAGQTHNMSVTITHSGSSKFGFNLVALDTNNASIGTLTAGTGSQVLNGPSSRRNLTHTSSGTSTSTAGSKVFNFTWTAPTSYVGPVTFYAAGNAANGDGGTSGDFVYTGNLSVSGNPITALVPDLLEGFSMYPNPVVQGNAISLDFEGGVEKLEIIDYKGAVLFRLLNPESGIRIPTNQFIKGAYLVRLMKDEKSLTKRLLVN
jgi:hypothetical protein